MGEKLKDSFIMNFEGVLGSDTYKELYFDLEHDWFATVFLSGYSSKSLVELQVKLDPEASYMLVRGDISPMQFDPRLWIEGKKRVCCRMYNKDLALPASVSFSVSVKLYCKEE